MLSQLGCQKGNQNEPQTDQKSNKKYVEFLSFFCTENVENRPRAGLENHQKRAEPQRAPTKPYYFVVIYPKGSKCNFKTLSLRSRRFPSTAVYQRFPTKPYYFVVIYPKGTQCNSKTPKVAFRQLRNLSASRPRRYYFVVIYPKGTKCNFKTPKGAFRQPRKSAALRHFPTLPRTILSQGN